MAARRMLASSVMLLATCWWQREPPTTPTASPSPECVENAGPGQVKLCRRGNEVEWTITNATDKPILALAAPQDLHCCPSLQAAYAAIDAGGNLVLRKVQLAQATWVGGEPSYTGTYEIPAHGQLSDRVHVGKFLNPADPEMPLQSGSTHVPVRTVALEVGWIDTAGEHSPDSNARANAGEFARSQHLVRSPVLPWR